MSPESHPENEQNIQREQQRLDELDATQDQSINLGKQREQLTQTYLKKVNSVQGRIRDIYKKIEVQKDMRAPHWQKLESVCLDVEGKLLERLAAIDQENMCREIATFNGAIDEFLLSLSHAEKKTGEEAEVKEDKTFSLLQSSLDRISIDREAQIDERTHLQDQLKRVQEAILRDTKKLGELAKKEDRAAQPAVVSELENQQADMQDIQAKIALTSQRITMLDLSATALQAHSERKQGNSETADRLLLKLKETHGTALESMHPGLWQKAEQAEQALRTKGSLTQFEELLLTNQSNTLSVALEKQQQSSLGDVDLLDQYRGWGLSRKEENPRVHIKRETRSEHSPFQASITSSRLVSLGRDSMLQLHKPQQPQLGTMHHGELILLQGTSDKGSAELQKPIVLAFRDRESVVRLQDGSVVQQPVEIRPSTVNLGGIGGRSMENIYLSPEAQKMFEHSPYGSRVILRDAPKKIQIQSWNAPSVRMLTSADLAFASTNNDNLFIRDRKEKTISVSTISTLEKEREEQSRDVLRALDRDPAVRDVMGKTTSMQMNLQSIGELISSGTAKSAEKAAEYVEYARTQARPLLTLLNDPQLKTNLKSVKQQLESLKGTSFGFALGGIEKEIDERIDAIDNMVDTLESNDIRRMCETILDKSKFHQDTWGQWLKTEGPKFLAAIVVATVAIVTIVATFGAATPLWAIAAAGAAGGIVGSELAAEGVHLSYHLFDKDIRSGKATYSDRSILGKYFEGQKVIDPVTGKERDMSFIFDVANPYAKQFFVGFVITFATIGAGRWAAGKVSQYAQNLKWVQSMTGSGGFQKMSQALVRIKAGYESIADKSLARKIVMESLQEIGEEGTEAGIQQGLNRIDVRLGILAGFLVVTAQGIRVRPRVRGFSVEVPPTASLEHAQATLQVQLEAEGHATETTDNIISVTMWNGEKMEVELLQVAENSNNDQESDTNKSETLQNPDMLAQSTNTLEEMGIANATERKLGRENADIYMSYVLEQREFLPFLEISPDDVPRLQRVQRAVRKELTGIAFDESIPKKDRMLYARVRNRIAQCHIGNPHFCIKDPKKENVYHLCIGEGRRLTAHREGNQFFVYYPSPRNMSPTQLGEINARLAKLSQSSFFPEMKLATYEGKKYVAVDFVPGETAKRNIDVREFYEFCREIGFGADTNCTNFRFSKGNQLQYIDNDVVAWALDPSSQPFRKDRDSTRPNTW
ncbi:MAG: hypothetical protein ABIA92_00240 [Patescibacteria group bacterium]